MGVVGWQCVDCRIVIGWTYCTTLELYLVGVVSVLVTLPVRP